MDRRLVSGDRRAVTRGGRRAEDAKARPRCRMCGGHDNRVIDVRYRARDESVARRHECICGYRWNSTQKNDDPQPVAYQN